MGTSQALALAQEHSDVIQKVLRMARKGTKVTYITGNHDEFIRGFLPIVMGDNLEICNETTYQALNGKQLLVTHGDFFDSISMTKKWLAFLGDRSYIFLLNINRPLNRIRKILGYKKYWSLSQYLKLQVKKSVAFITNFETILANTAKEKGYDGVICGHIHHAEIKEIEGIEYLNCGDWVESCTALVEDHEGRWEIITFHEQAL